MPKLPPLTLTDEMPFGKYTGELVGTVCEDDPSYMAWCLENLEVNFDPEVEKYVRECL